MKSKRFNSNPLLGSLVCEIVFAAKAKGFIYYAFLDFLS